jgi:uncharacterized membrane protein
MDMDIAVGIFFRWLHVVTACVAVGGLFFMRLVLPLGLRTLDAVVRDEIYLRFRRVFKIVIHTCILLFLLSGTYNAWANWPAYKMGVPLTHALFGVHLLGALLVFAVALFVLAGKKPPRTGGRWLMVNLILALLTIAAASSLKWARERGVRQSTTPTVGLIDSARGEAP